MRKGKEYVMTVAAARKVARMLNGEWWGIPRFPYHWQKNYWKKVFWCKVLMGGVAVIGYVMWKDVALFWPNAMP